MFIITENREPVSTKKRSTETSQTQAGLYAYKNDLHELIYNPDSGKIGFYKHATTRVSNFNIH